MLRRATDMFDKINDFVSLMSSSTPAGTCAFIGAVLTVVGLAHLVWPGTMALYPSWQKERNKRAGYKYGAMYLMAGVSLAGFGVAYAEHDPLAKNSTVSLAQPVRFSAFSVKLPLDRNWQQLPGIDNGFAFRTVDLPDRAYVLEFHAKAYPLDKSPEQSSDALYEPVFSQIGSEALPEAYSKKFETFLDLIKTEVAKENSGITNLEYKIETRPIHRVQEASCMHYRFTITEQPSAEASQHTIDRFSQTYTCYHPRYPGIWADLTYAERLVRGHGALSHDFEAQAGSYFDSLVFETVK
jgi:hypothetical protein